MIEFGHNAHLQCPVTAFIFFSFQTATALLFKIQSSLIILQLLFHCTFLPSGHVHPHCKDADSNTTTRTC